MSESEQTQSYDVPSVEGLSSDEAVASLEKINADVVANPKHPYCNSAHPQSKGFKDAVTRLYEIKHGELTPEPLDSATAETPEDWQKAKSAEQFGPAEVKAMGDALDEREGRNEEVQAKLIEGIQKEVEQINELMPGSDISDDEAIENATPEKLEGYKMMRLQGQKDYASLTPLVMGDLQKMGAPKEKASQVQDLLLSASTGDKWSAEHVNLIIRQIYEVKTERAGRGT